MLAQSYRRLFRLAIKDSANEEKTHTIQNRIDDSNNKLLTRKVLNVYRNLPPQKSAPCIDRRTGPNPRGHKNASRK